MLIRERKENVFLYIKQLSDDSIGNTVLDTPYFCSSLLEMITVMLEPNTLIPPKKEWKNNLLFYHAYITRPLTMDPWD